MEFSLIVISTSKDVETTLTFFYYKAVQCCSLFLTMEELKMSKNGKHLSLEDRIRIEESLANGASRSAIAQTLGKDKSTICKEVQKHRQNTTKYYGRAVGGVYDCVYIKECELKFCSKPCYRYERSRCSRRDRTVGVCNGCDRKSQCQLTKITYNAHKAHQQYREDLVDSRTGINMTISQAKELGNILKPLIDKGQSVYSILVNHPEIPYCEKTIYNYIQDGVFSQNGLYDIDLHLKTKRRSTKNKIVSKPRVNRAYLKGRTYDDYLEYMSLHPHAKVVEMDTIYNDVSHGPFVQTFQLVELNLMLGMLHQHKTTEAMLSGLVNIKERLTPKYFQRFVQVVLVDRGSEFVCAQDFEALGIKVFYCDPMASWQKPHVENNHLLVRRILPKEKNLTKLGLTSQDDLDLIFSHINSYTREELYGKTPIDLLLFFNQDNQEILDCLKIEKIPPDQVTLKPSLLKKD